MRFRISYPPCHKGGKRKIPSNLVTQKEHRWSHSRKQDCLPSRVPSSNPRTTESICRWSLSTSGKLFGHTFDLADDLGLSSAPPRLAALLLASADNLQFRGGFSIAVNKLQRFSEELPSCRLEPTSHHSIEVPFHSPCFPLPETQSCSRTLKSALRLEALHLACLSPPLVVSNSLFQCSSGLEACDAQQLRKVLSHTIVLPWHLPSGCLPLPFPFSTRASLPSPLPLNLPFPLPLSMAWGSS